MPDLYDYVDQEKTFVEDERTMKVWPRYYEELVLNAKFEVCHNCQGRGSHSKHLGSYTREEFDETFWDDEDREDYFSGGYDMQCEICNGKRVVLVPDPERNSKELMERWEKVMDEEYQYRAQQLAELRAGC